MKGRSLLEMLRRFEVKKYTAEDKLKLSMEHRDEFPSKIREIICFAVEYWSHLQSPETVLEVIYFAIEEFFLGRQWCLMSSVRLIVDNNPSEEETRERLRIIIKYRGIFPSELQPAISYAEDLSKGPPKTAFEGIQSVAMAFFSDGTRKSKEWHGLNKSIDTEDQAEVAILFFPDVLFKLRDGRDPICWLASSPKAVCFVPLLLRLGHCGFGTKVRYSFSENCLRNVKRCLLCNNSWHWVDIKIYSEELDRESLLALIHLKDIGFVYRDEYFSLLNCLLTFWNNTENYFDGHDADFVTFFQTRFKLLLDWAPFLIENYMMNDDFWIEVSCFHAHNDEVIEPVIRTVCKVALSHYPMELGLMFSQRYFDKYVRPELRERREKAQKIIFDIGREEITRAMKHNKAVIKDWVYAVATNDRISPDGLYMLIRCDPIGVLMSDSS